MCQQWWESWGSRKHYLLKFSLEISPDKKEIKRRGMSCKNCADIGGKSCLARHVTWNMLLADLLGQITDNLIINWAISSEQSLIGVLEDIILQWYMSIFSQILNTDFQPRQYLILRMCFLRRGTEEVWGRQGCGGMSLCPGQESLTGRT